MNQRTFEIPAPPVHLVGDLIVPGDAGGLVVFAHGSGSSRLSTRNAHAASALNEHGLATLLFDLLTPDRGAPTAGTSSTSRCSARDGSPRRAWVRRASAHGGASPRLLRRDHRRRRRALRGRGLSVTVAAVVSRGGCPDLAGDASSASRAPTLLIVGAADPTVLALNEQAGARLRCPQRIEVVPGATHLFEEPGALKRVSELAAAWFSRLLSRLAGAGELG